MTTDELLAELEQRKEIVPRTKDGIIRLVRIIRAADELCSSLDEWITGDWGIDFSPDIIEELDKYRKVRDGDESL